MFSYVLSMNHIICVLYDICNKYANYINTAISTKYTIYANYIKGTISIKSIIYALNIINVYSI